MIDNIADGVRRSLIEVIILESALLVLLCIGLLHQHVAVGLVQLLLSPYRQISYKFLNFVYLTIGHLVPIIIALDVAAMLLLMLDKASHIRFKGATSILDCLHLLIEDVTIDMLCLLSNRRSQRALILSLRSSRAPTAHSCGVALILHAWFKTIIQKLIVLFVFEEVLIAAVVLECAASALRGTTMLALIHYSLSMFSINLKIYYNLY